MTLKSRTVGDSALRSPAHVKDGSADEVALFSGFPTSAIPCIRCIYDGNPLELSESESTGQGGFIMQGSLVCRGGGHRFAITDGIARLIDASAIAEVSRVEREIRDIEATPFKAEDIALPENALEIEPTLREVERGACDRILEVGCGSGRYTSLLAKMAGLVVAIDFSGESLRIAGRSLPSGAAVALVEADATQFRAAPATFDVALSTLVSNLPSCDDRAAMFAVVAAALVPGGRFVFGTHYFGIREWLRRTPRVGHYPGSGIFRQYFRRREIEREAKPYFRHLASRPIAITIPGARWLGLPMRALNRWAAHVPLLREFGFLLLTVGETPVVEEARGVN